MALNLQESMGLGKMELVSHFFFFLGGGWRGCLFMLSPTTMVMSVTDTTLCESVEERRMAIEKYFMINLKECMGLGQDRTLNPKFGVFFAFCFWVYLRASQQLWSCLLISCMLTIISITNQVR